MSEMQPQNWVKHVESVAIGAQDASMWGSIPSFPWKKFADELQKALGIQELMVTGGPAEWKKGSEILSGMGRSPLQLAMEMSPLKGSVSMILPSEDFSKLSSWTIDPEAGNESFSDSYLQKGFFRYLGVIGLSVIDALQVFQGLTPKMVDMPLAKEDAYCIDIAIEHAGETIWGRVICPTLFQESLKHHFARDWNFSIPSHLYQELMVDVSLCAGKSQLLQEHWLALRLGDFVLLDHCSYYPKLKRGTFQLAVDNTPLFQVKVKEDAIKLLDYAHYFEDKTVENENSEKLYEDHIEEETASTKEESKPPMLSPKKVPINLTVEVARLKMSLDKLLKLKPGNVLELGVQPERGVDLVSNGRCIGKGELLQIGDVIGVKITKLGE